MREVSPGQQEIFRHRHPWGQGEVLVHHPDAKFASDHRIRDELLASIAQDRALVGGV